MIWLGDADRRLKSALVRDKLKGSYEGARRRGRPVKTLGEAAEDKSLCGVSDSMNIRVTLTRWGLQWCKIYPFILSFRGFARIILQDDRFSLFSLMLREMRELTF